MVSVASCTCCRNVCDGDGMVCIAVDRVHDIEENIMVAKVYLLTSIQVYT